MKSSIAVIILFILMFVFAPGFSQNTVITDDPVYSGQGSAMLDVKSLDKGLLVPRLTTMQMNGIVSPSTGLLVFNTDLNSFCYYNGTSWLNLTSAMIPAGLGVDKALFVIRNAAGDTVFAVFPEGVRVYVGDGISKGSGNKGGFAVGGFGTGKLAGQELFRITQDSVRVYIDKNTVKGSGNKGGFAVGGFGTGKLASQEVLRITQDSVRVYIDKNVVKGSGNKGGFAVGGFGSGKNLVNNYLSVNSDSIKVSKALYIPRMTTVERDTLGFIPSEALIIFNMTDKCMQIYENGVWSNIWCFHCTPTIIVQPLNTTLCANQSGSFTITATGTNLAYQWQYSPDNGSTWFNLSDGGTAPVYSGSNTFSLSLTNVPETCNGFLYRCNVVASCLPGTNSNAALLNVGSSGLSITQQPANVYFVQGCGASFTVVTSAYANFQWQSSDGGWHNISNGGNNPSYAGATEATLSMFGIPSTYNGFQYRCVVSSTCASTLTSGNATLNYQSTPTATAVTNLTHTSYTANWLPVPNATTYYLDISINSSFTYFINGFNGLNVGLITSYNVDGLDANTTYYYRIRARTTCGNENLVNSNAITVATPAFYIGENYGGGVIFSIDPVGHHGLLASATDNGGGNWTQTQVICSDLVLNNYDDWYLPSYTELQVLSGQRITVGGFSYNGLWYWSSTEDSDRPGQQAWYYFIATGNTNWGYSTTQSTPASARCIRQF